jgi:hypothetical protein
MPNSHHPFAHASIDYRERQKYFMSLYIAKGYIMEKGRARRKCPRIPVYLDVRIDLMDGIAIKGKIINLSTEGVCVKSDEPVWVKEVITTEFLLPHTLNSVRLAGEVVWYRFDAKAVEEGERVHSAGVRFLDLAESYRSLIRYFTLKMLHDAELVREQGIDRVLSDVLNLPPKEREAALVILKQKGFITEKQMVDFSRSD